MEVCSLGQCGCADKAARRRDRTYLVFGDVWSVSDVFFVH